MLKRLVFAATVLSAGAAMAAPAGVAVSHGGAVTIFQGTPSFSKAPDISAKKGAVIFSNLGTAYNSSIGWTISAKGSQLAAQNWVAFGFTPTATTPVTEIDVAVSFVNGTNGALVSLYSSSNGVPGTVLQTKSVKNLQTFGNCCAVAVDRIKTVIKLKKGVQYFVAVTTNKKTATTWDAWNQVTSSTPLPAATNPSGTWVAINGGLGPAGGFAVYGK